jgi:hypothetical protein
MYNSLSKRAIVCLGFLSLALLAQSVPADVVSFQDGTDNIFVTGYAGTEDNQMLGAVPCCSGFEDSNMGSRNALQIGNASAGSTRRSIIRFTGLSVMSGAYASIDSARIVLWKVNGNTGGPTDGMQMYAIDNANADWVEGGGNFTPASDDGSSSWNSKAHPTAWVGGAGGGTLGALQDTLAGVSGSDAPNTLYSFDLDPALVDQWITGINAGVLVKDENDFDANHLQIEVGSAEFGDSFARPRLEITYTVPEPASLVLLSLGGLVMLGRRSLRGLRS